MTSQLVIFRAFLFIFFRPSDPRSEKKSRKSTNKKKIWPELHSNNNSSMSENVMSLQIIKLRVNVPASR